MADDHKDGKTGDRPSGPKKPAAKATAPVRGPKAPTDHFFEVVQARSGTGRPDTQKRTLAGLGLRHIGQAVSLRDTPAIRGMIYKVVHLVTVSRKTGPLPPSSRARRLAARGAGHPAS